eukprot:11104736-Alexandrium_andersonii.AAC.1
MLPPPTIARSAPRYSPALLGRAARAAEVWEGRGLRARGAAVLAGPTPATTAAPAGSTSAPLTGCAGAGV